MSAHLPLPTREELVQAITASRCRATLKLACLVLAAIGVALFAVRRLHRQRRAWQALHFNWLFFTTLSSAGVMFAAVQRITTARWSRPIVRFVEGLRRVPAGGVRAAAAHPVPRRASTSSRGRTEAIAVAGEGGLPRRRRSSALRGILLFGAHHAAVSSGSSTPRCGSTSACARGGRRLGRGPARRACAAASATSAASCTRTHSLQGKVARRPRARVRLRLVVPRVGLLDVASRLHFQSTMYGWWLFMGGVALHAHGSCRCSCWRGATTSASTTLITENHFHDLGKLCFAFTAFWGYLTFSQYLVIWYGNLAEETHFFRLRLIGPVEGAHRRGRRVMVFLLPFFGLLSQGGEGLLADDADAVRRHQPLGHVAAPLPRDLSVALRQATALPFGLWEIGVAARAPRPVGLVLHSRS